MGRLRILAAMVAKDLQRRRRAPLGVILILAFPLVFAGILALSFGSASEPKVPKVHLLIEDRDDGLVAKLVRSAFTAEQAEKYFEVEAVGAEGRQRMEDGEASALLRIPEGFSRDVLDGRPTTLELVRNPSQSILPEIAQQITEVVAEALSSATYVLQGPLNTLRPLLEDGAEDVPDLSVATIAVDVNHVVRRVGSVLFPPVITVEQTRLGVDVEKRQASDPVGIFLVVLPGLAVFALFTLGDRIMRDILTEVDQGTLRRQLSAPLSTRTVIVAKALSTGLVALLSLLLLAAIAWWASGGADLSFGAFAVVGGALVATVTGAAATIYGFARTGRQGATLASVVYLVLAFSSGSFIPLDSLPASVRQLAPWNPFHWATSAFQSLLLEGAGLAEVGASALRLAALGIVLLAFGAHLLRRRLTAGEAP